MSLAIVKEIESVLSSPSNRCKYPAGMIAITIKLGGSATRTEISTYLAKINKSEDVAYYRSIPVYANNKAIQRIFDTDKTQKDYVYSIKNYQELTKIERENLLKLANKIANEWECITA